MLDTTVLFTSPDKDNLYVKKHILRQTGGKRTHGSFIGLYRADSKKQRHRLHSQQSKRYIAMQYRNILQATTNDSQSYELLRNY